MFSTITTAPSTTIPKSRAPSDSRLAGILFRSRQMEAKSSEKGMVSATIKAPRDVAQKQKQNQRDQDDAFASGCEERCGWCSEAGRCGRGAERSSLPAAEYDRSVPSPLSWIASSVESESAPLRKQHDAFHHIVVVDDLAIGAMDGFPDFARAGCWGLGPRWRCL